MDLCHGGVRRSGWVRGRLAAPNTVNRLRRLCNMHAHLRWVPFRTCWGGEEVGRLRRKTSCTSLLLQRFRTTLYVQMDCCPTRDVATKTKKCSRLGGGGEWRRHRLPRSYPAPPSDGTIHAARGEVHLLHCEGKILGSRSAGSYTPRRAGAEPHEPPSGFCIVSFSVMLNRRGARHEPPGPLTLSPSHRTCLTRVVALKGRSSTRCAQRRVSAFRSRDRGSNFVLQTPFVGVSREHSTRWEDPLCMQAREDQPLPSYGPMTPACVVERSGSPMVDRHTVRGGRYPPLVRVTRISKSVSCGSGGSLGDARRVDRNAAGVHT